MTARHRQGCLICGKDLHYFSAPRPLQCAVCGESFPSTAACAEGHYVCDACHGRAGIEAVTRLALETPLADPVKVAALMMAEKSINLHGPEHHYLVPAALLAAYKNAGGAVDLKKALSLAAGRAAKAPGGICGLWGCCGAGIGTGIFVSVVTSATPLSTREWRLANQMTARSLAAISEAGGPRCCKRDTYLAIVAAIDFTRENLGVAMEKSAPVCAFSPLNSTCLKGGCPFYDPLAS